MGKSTDVRSYEYVNQPYDRVRDALLADPSGTFSEATRAASDRAQSVAASLRVKVGPVEVGAEVDLSVGGIVEVSRGQWRNPATRVPITWGAAHAQRFFPMMRGTLSAYPLTPTETQLDFEGSYEPPLGPLGTAIDAAVGHRIAEASVHRFLEDVAHHLRDKLAT